MKSLRESLLDDIDAVSDKIDVRVLIEEWLDYNLSIGKGCCKISEKPNKDGKYEISSRANVVFKNISTSLTNGAFVWTEIKGNFTCCRTLTSLEGAPRKVKGCFCCNSCSNLTSLEGAPEKVGESFLCGYCDSLKSLKGAPREVEGGFYVSYCDSLKTLEGAPEKVGRDFHCNNCKSLKSLKGAPKTIGGSFSCNNCAKQFTEDEVKSVCDVKGILFV